MTDDFVEAAGEAAMDLCGPAADLALQVTTLLCLLPWLLVSPAGCCM